jgi:hypothetical protein
MPDIIIIEFMRSPALLVETLFKSADLERHRDAMLSVGRPCFFGHGIKLLITPEDVHDVLWWLSATDFIRFEDGFIVAVEDMRPRHLILSMALEFDFLQALDRSPGTGHEGGKCRDNVKVKRKVNLMIPRLHGTVVERAVVCTTNVVVSDVVAFCIAFDLGLEADEDELCMRIQHA